LLHDGRQLRIPGIGRFSFSPHGFVRTTKRQYHIIAKP